MSEVPARIGAMIPNREAIAWAAGLYEGEGCASVTNKRGQPSLRIAVRMTDEDVLYQFADAVQMGHVSGPHARSASALGKKPLYLYALYSFERCQALIAMFWPWLGTRRRQQARKALTETRWSEASYMNTVAFEFFDKKRQYLTDEQRRLVDAEAFRRWMAKGRRGVRGGRTTA